MSFRGFNSEVEKLMLQMNAKSTAKEVEDETVELDESMKKWLEDKTPWLG